MENLPIFSKEQQRSLNYRFISFLKNYPGIFLLFTFLVFLVACSESQITVPLEKITIYRDGYGVPHIHAPTDEEVAYGLAWASCEDDFITIQEQMLAIQGKLGEWKGKDGIVADFAIKFMRLRQRAIEAYPTISIKYRNILEQYVAGINAYAAIHPQEVLLKDGFPVSPYDALAGYMLGLVEISGASSDLRKIMENDLNSDENANFQKGSNAIAISPLRTPNGESYLAINSHQPMEGWYSWYEVHLISDEGQNILGGTFPGGSTIFHGTNEHLGWAHTVNHADFSDIYKLEMHPDEELAYKIDGGYKKLQSTSYKSWLKLLGPIKIPITRTVYESDFGTTFKTDSGYYAWRFVASDAALAPEQWYQMNRATNWDQFHQALERQAIPCTNIVYADNQENIFYISNGKIPKREASFDWKKILPGTDSRLSWDDGYWPLDSLPQVLNPASGFVFNTNNTPFHSTMPSDDPEFKSRYVTMGYLTPDLDNNRSARLLTLLASDSSITYEEFKAIKYDRQYPDTLIQPYMLNLELLLQLEETAHQEIKEGIAVLKKWNRRTDPTNEQAMFFILARSALADKLTTEKRNNRQGTITEDDCHHAIAQAMQVMKEKFNSLEIPLGDVQRHIRGKVNLPIGGGPDVIAAIYAKPSDNIQYRAYTGETYIQLVRFRKDALPIIETVNAYGTSAKPESPHYTDQMELFVHQQLKPMSLSLEEVKTNAVKVYHPLSISRPTN